jgi:hypothetical protein
MGGNVPLGYDVKDRKLIVNEPEASTVRLIFRRYAELGSVSLLRAPTCGRSRHRYYRCYRAGLEDWKWDQQYPPLYSLELLAYLHCLLVGEVAAEPPPWPNASAGPLAATAAPSAAEASYTPKRLIAVSYVILDFT